MSSPEPSGILGMASPNWINVMALVALLAAFRKSLYSQ